MLATAFAVIAAAICTAAFAYRRVMSSSADGALDRDATMICRYASQLSEAYSGSCEAVDGTRFISGRFCRLPRDYRLLTMPEQQMSSTHYSRSGDAFAEGVRFLIDRKATVKHGRAPRCGHACLHAAGWAAAGCLFLAYQCH